MSNLMIACAAGRRGAGSIDCITCGQPIHQRPHPGLSTPDEPWYAGDGDTTGMALVEGNFVTHTHAPAHEIGPVLGPFEYVDLTYASVRVQEGEVLALWDEGRGDWILTDLAGDHAGEAYSDLTITTQDNG